MLEVNIALPCLFVINNKETSYSASCDCVVFLKLFNSSASGRNKILIIK